MRYEITTLHKAKLIGIAKQIAFNQGAEECPKFWGEFFETLIKPAQMEGKAPNAMQQAVIDNRIGAYGLCTCDLPHHNCASCGEENFTACNSKRFTYVIGGIYQGGDLPEGMSLYPLYSGSWLKMHFEGGLKAFQQQYAYFHKEWLPQHPAFQLAKEASCLEWYDGADTESPDYACGVMVPLETMPLIKATMADLKAIDAFYDHVVCDTPSMQECGLWKKDLYPTRKEYEKYIAMEAMYLYKEGDEIVGAMAVTPSQGADYHVIPWSRQVADDEVSVIHLLAVNPDHQGKGLGPRLVRAGIQVAKAAGKKVVRLDTTASNAPARRVYEQIGFVFQGEHMLNTVNSGWTNFHFFEYAEL